LLLRLLQVCGHYFYFKKNERQNMGCRGSCGIIEDSPFHVKVQNQQIGYW